ncbi:MAG: hypothetical protein KF852_04295 [Saprospiraceae bacterium]|nr:hypothetical protein [Saprospiraceae bacterium]
MTLFFGKVRRAAYSWGVDWETPQQPCIWLQDYDQGLELAKDLHNALTEIAGDLCPALLTDFQIVFMDRERKWHGIHINTIGTEKMLKEQWQKVRDHKAISRYLTVEIVPAMGRTIEEARAKLIGL